MTQLIGILTVLAILILIAFLFWPVLRDQSGGEFYLTGITKEKERQTREEFLSRRIADLTLDRDSGKLSAEEHAELIRPLAEERSALASIMAKNALVAVLIGLVVGLFAQAPLSAMPLAVEGRIVNGTTGQMTGAERIELLRIQEGMQVIETLTNSGPTFRFKPVEQGDSPLLVRATYAGESYIAVLQPGQGSQEKTATEITVFDSGARIEEIEFHSGLQISRLKEGLDVTLVYAISNNSKPGRSFDISNLTFPLPDGISGLSATVAHQSSNMPVTLQPEPTTGGVRFKRSLRPGMSELSIRYRTDSYILKDRVDFTKDVLVNRGTGRSFFRVLIWRPADARPEIVGAHTEDLDIPKLGKALQVIYDADEVEYRFNRGGIWFDDPMASDENPVFDRPWKSVIGLLLALTIFLLLLSILTGSKIRLTRDGR